MADLDDAFPNPQAISGHAVWALSTPDTVVAVNVGMNAPGAFMDTEQIRRLIGRCPLDDPPRLRLAVVENRPHHLVAEQDWTLLHALSPS